MRKLIALLTAATLFASMTVSAAPSPSAAAVSASGASSEGFRNTADQEAASTRGMTAGEYYNNAIVSTPGVAKNLTATLAKVDKATAEGAKAQAGALGGTLLNVVKVGFPGANYNTATINFYLKGLANGAKVAVKQFVNGVWVDVEVVEVRADHVVLNLVNSGAVAFVQLP